MLNTELEHSKMLELFFDLLFFSLKSDTNFSR